MTDLVEWLRARLDEDERVAKAATPGPWHEPGPDSVGEWNIYGDGWVIAATQHYPREDMQNYWPKLRKPATVVEHGNENADHIARHDPARVLREVEAKRRIIDRHTMKVGEQVTRGICAECGGSDWKPSGADRLDPYPWVMPWPCPTLRLLALPYSDRPGYREEWRP